MADSNQADCIDTSDEACALACMLVSNPQGALRKDGDGWQRRVNDLIRALRDERNDLRTKLSVATDELSHADLRGLWRHSRRALTEAPYGRE